VQRANTAAVHNQLDEKGDLMRQFRMFSLAVLVAAAALTAACADGNLRTLAGPSPLALAHEPTAAVPASGGPVDAAAVNGWVANTGWMTAAAGSMVEGSAAITAVSGACPDRVVTMRGVPVLMNSGTAFGGGITCGALTAGRTVHIAGLLTQNNGAYTLIATAISVDETPTPGGNESGRGREHVGGEGTVASLTGACPSLSMIVRGYSVTTSPATVYVGGTCEALRPGMKVQVTGVFQADSLLAETMDIKD
jgi:hypothetical protein